MLRETERTLGTRLSLVVFAPTRLLWLSSRASGLVTEGPLAQLLSGIFGFFFLCHWLINRLFKSILIVRLDNFGFCRYSRTSNNGHLSTTAIFWQSVHTVLLVSCFNISTTTIFLADSPYNCIHVFLYDEMFIYYNFDRPCWSIAFFSSPRFRLAFLEERNAASKIIQNTNLGIWVSL